ncbi:hypothetical protein U1Q18_017373 [Sarracenia purpurea var. burkii]
MVFGFASGSTPITSDYYAWVLKVNGLIPVPLPCLSKFLLVFLSTLWCVDIEENKLCRRVQGSCAMCMFAATRETLRASFVGAAYSS